MLEEELVAAFTEGRLTRRAFVRQMVDHGMPLGDALSYAERLVPQTTPAAAGPAADGAEQRAMAAKPVQADGLEIHFVGDGYVVLDQSGERIHSLNHTAALILELCTGDNDGEEIARLLETDFRLSAPPLRETRTCLETLFDEGLIL